MTAPFSGFWQPSRHPYALVPPFYLRFEQGAICGAGGIKVPASHSDAFYPYAALRERACSVSSPEAPTNVWPKSLVLVGGGFV